MNPSGNSLAESKDSSDAKGLFSENGLGRILGSERKDSKDGFISGGGRLVRTISSLDGNLFSLVIK